LVPADAYAVFEVEFKILKSYEDFVREFIAKLRELKYDKLADTCEINKMTLTEFFEQENWDMKQDWFVDRRTHMAIIYSDDCLHIGECSQRGDDVDKDLPYIRVKDDSFAKYN